jgi:hypothetical protein
MLGDDAEASGGSNIRRVTERRGLLKQSTGNFPAITPAAS